MAGLRACPERRRRGEPLFWATGSLEVHLYLEAWINPGDAVLFRQGMKVKQEDFHRPLVLKGGLVRGTEVTEKGVVYGESRRYRFSIRPLASGPKADQESRAWLTRRKRLRCALESSRILNGS